MTASLVNFGDRTRFDSSAPHNNFLALIVMTLNEYQEKAMTTCMPSSDNFSYMMLNLVGEVGEFASKVAKAIRKEKASIEGCKLVGVLSEEESHDLQKEAGDCMWQIAGLCKVMGWNLEDVCQDNLDKLASRKKRDVIDGSGDNR